MRKHSFVLLLASVTSIGLVISLTIQDSAYAQIDTENLVVTIKDIRTQKLANSDLVRIKLNILNNADDEVRLYSGNFALLDSQLRKYAATSAYELEEKGESISEGICEMLFGQGANPGLSFALEVCFEVPKTNFQYDSLIIYENMIMQATNTAKIVPLVENSIGYQILVEKIQPEDEKLAIRAEEVESKGGCLIATAAYGTELAPQVQQLRELRDSTLLQTNSGSAFMTAFNQFYYSFAPTVADWERQNPIFKEAVKITITPLLTTLSILNYVDIDSEAEMLGYGIGVIMLNIGMYFVTPAFVIVKLKQKI